MTQHRPAPAVVYSVAAPRGLTGTVAEQLGRQIVSGAIGPDALLQIEQIEEVYNVSRTVVREALRVLEGKRLITARPNVGTRVRPVAQWNLLDADVIRWRAAARCEESVDHDILEFTRALYSLSPQMNGNLLYEQLMEDLTGVPRAARRDFDAQAQTEPDNCTAPQEPVLEDAPVGAVHALLAEASA